MMMRILTVWLASSPIIFRGGLLSMSSNYSRGIIHMRPDNYQDVFIIYLSFRQLFNTYCVHPILDYIFSKYDKPKKVQALLILMELSCCFKIESRHPHNNSFSAPIKKYSVKNIIVFFKFRLFVILE